MPKNGLRTKTMGFANKMSESIIAERLYWCSRNAILFANCSQIKEKAPINLCKCLIFNVDQPGLEPGTSRL